MIRRNENPLALRAGALSVLVHVLFFLLLFMGFNWKSVKPLQVAEVELWDALPMPTVTKPTPKPLQPKHAPEPVVKPKPVPPPPPPAEVKADIVVKPKPPEKPKPEKKPELKKVEKPKADPRIKAAAEAKRREEEMKRLQQMLASEEQQTLAEEQRRESQQMAAERAAQASAQMQGEMDAALDRIARRIRQFVNRQVCGTGKPVLTFKIALMPTGEIIGNPTLVSGSGIPACDQAVERAIIQAQPLPLPSDPDLIARLRDLELKFKPNE